MLQSRSADLERQLLVWARAREKRNPDGHGRTGTELLRSAALHIRELQGEIERLMYAE